jgi:2-C-methyl-D-erythritol 2,4-cyclodiphosphate synthase
VSGLRIGLGYDVHAFVDGRDLILGGVRVPHPRGLLGHSDADVLVHALMDALLGAMRLGDIGSHFPATEPEYAGASSISLLEQVRALMESEGWRLVDTDLVLVLEAPRIAPHRDAMRLRIAGALGISIEQVGLKATTTEGLGSTGRGEGVAAQAVVLLERV